MNITTIPLHILHKLHLEIIEEMKLCEQNTQQLNIQLEREQASIKQNLDQMIQERDQEFRQQQKTKEVVEATQREFPDLDVREEEPVEDKIANLGLAVRRYKEKIVAI